MYIKLGTKAVAAQIYNDRSLKDRQIYSDSIDKLYLQLEAR